MAIKCPDCGRQFDITLFEYGKTVICPCGRELSLEHREILLEYSGMEELERDIFQSSRSREERERDRERMDRIKWEADKISSLILYSDMQRIDVEIAISKFREEVLADFPDKKQLLEALYLARFRRLWEQFRPGEGELLPDWNDW
jgi:hypothetical protein